MNVNDSDLTDGPDELTGAEEHERDSQYQGDARRCPRHPNVKTSSDDGLFDGVCGRCEMEMDLQAGDEIEVSDDPELEKISRYQEYDDSPF